MAEKTKRKFAVCDSVVLTQSGKRGWIHALSTHGRYAVALQEGPLTVVHGRFLRDANLLVTLAKAAQ